MRSLSQRVVDQHAQQAKAIESIHYLISAGISFILSFLKSHVTFAARGGLYGGRGKEGGFRIFGMRTEDGCIIHITMSFLWLQHVIPAKAGIQKLTTV